jgi:glucose/arabinose dehydrogenase
MRIRWKFRVPGRALRAAAALGLAAALGGAATARASVAAPAITEPGSEGQVVSPYDVHMVAGPFAGSPGETHVCSDWQIVDTAAAATVWSASCVTGTLAVHIHLGDGVFGGSLTGLHQLDAGRDYRVRVRFQGSLPGSDWSGWSERGFHTASATEIEVLVLSDVSSVPAPRWQDASGGDVVLPAAEGLPGALHLEVPGAGDLLAISGLDGTANVVSNPAPLGAHGSVRAVCRAGAAALAIPASRLAFTDGSGTDRVVELPPIALDPGQAVAFWISGAGEAFPADVASGGAAPDLGGIAAVSAAAVPWAVKQPGFRVERVATGFQLPVEIAFAPNPGASADEPFFYVSELYGTIKVVTRGGAVSTYATGLLNFDPEGSFPGSGEKGLAGIVVDPASGDLFAGAVEAVAGVTDFHFPRVMRLHSADGGRTESTRGTILDFPNEPLGASHQISNLSIGPDGKLYVHIGDGQLITPAQDLTSVRGKILRVNLDGSAPTDNPFYDAASGAAAANFIFASGFRNPFGGAWRAADGGHWEVENGPSIDRLAHVVAGRNYLWDGSDASMRNYAAYNWPLAVAPVNLAFVQPSTFGGSQFPASTQDHAFVSESGPTYAPGPQAFGKRVSEFVLDAQGALLSGPAPLIEYVGAGRATVAALAAGPDGLYFTDLYKDFGAASPLEAGSSVFRIRYVGVADFRADGASGRPPLTVAFHDASSVPGATAWHWEFGDGAESDARDPVHAYVFPGTYDVRLTVTGPAGAVARQKPAAVVVAAPARAVVCCPETPRAPRTVSPH